jgi:hypothetical protein
MRTSEPTSIPLAYAAEIIFELGLMRDECSQAARALMATRPLDEAAMEKCAILDDALAGAQRGLELALKRIKPLGTTCTQ